MKKALIFIFAFLLMANIAFAAINIQVTPKKTLFGQGDSIAFDYTITSSASQNIVFMPHISCPAMPIAIIEEKRAVLQAGNLWRGTYEGAEVSHDINSQECTASIEIISPEAAKKEVKLQIKTSPSFDFNLLSCTDSACSTQKRTFVKGSTVYLKGNSATTAQVTAPDGTSQRVSLPGSFTVSQSGEYRVEYTSTKSGYKQFKGTASIFVIEKAFTVPYADFSAKVGQAVVRPVFKAPSALAASNTATKAPATTAKKSSIKAFFTRVTGYFTAIF